MKHTKIVATISDIRCDVDFIRELYDAGMNVARLNTAHMTPETAINLINNVRAVSDHIAILVDTKGPEVRTFGIESPIAISEGEKIEFRGGPGQSKEGVIYVDYPGFVNDVPVGSSILVDDGELGFEVVDKTADALICSVGNKGVVKNKKSVNVPGVTICLPALTDKDKKFIEFAIEQDIEFIAHSFVRNKEDILAIQKILDEKDSKVKIIAKIENVEGVENIDEILDYAYGVMVARGDLGIEIPAEKIPGIQRSLIKKCVQKKKPVIVATQMLHTMISNPRPTRAEVSDVATAIYWRTDAIMLSGETAYGDYPVEAVKVMSRITEEAEADKDKRNDINLPRIDNEITAFFAEAAVEASIELTQTTAIMTDTLTGRTARYLSAFRAQKPVYAMCHNARVMRELSLSYGVFAEVIQAKKNKDKMVKSALKHMVETEQFTKKDTVVYVGGSFGVGGGTSFMEIASVEKLVEKNKSDQETI
ncbi:MAG: pyruvate kinase [Bacteroidota bacterium]|nr:pyruvate kinase [Bacteroidota bacterium]MDP4205665.1 pyruvate kinase [Bacteroidota bacterium]